MRRRKRRSFWCLSLGGGGQEKKGGGERISRVSLLLPSTRFAPVAAAAPAYWEPRSHSEASTAPEQRLPDVVLGYFYLPQRRRGALANFSARGSVVCLYVAPLSRARIFCALRRTGQRPHQQQTAAAAASQQLSRISDLHDTSSSLGGGPLECLLLDHSSYILAQPVVTYAGQIRCVGFITVFIRQAGSK